MKWDLVRAAFLALSIMGTPAVADDSAATLEGYWLSDTVMERANGNLVVTREGATWTAALGATKSVFQPIGGDIRVTLPAQTGALRARLSTDRQTIEGFWIQEGDQRQALATPVRLTSTGGDVWRGHVVALDLRFTLYARIFKREDGVVIVAFRNPQRNTRGGGSRLYVEREGETVRFLERNDGKPREDGRPAIVHTAKLLGNPDRIQMMWPEIGQPVEFVRKTAAEVEGYFPRLPGTTYRYTQPDAADDGWATARAGEAGLDEAALEQLVQRIAGLDPAERQPKLIHSLLIARKGKLVLEEYFFGHQRASLHDLRSAGKTFSSVMLGAVMQGGGKVSPDSRIVKLLNLAPAHPSPRKDKITLAHLMTHTSGLACNDNDENSPGNEDVMQSQAVGNWVKYALDLPMQHEPGKRYAYCSAGMNLVGGGLSAVTGEWLPALFDRTIARPLQFGAYAWNLAPNGDGYLGGGSRLRPRDLLKVGQLYLNGGTWNGRRVVSAEWVKRSIAPIVPINEETTGLDKDAFQNAYVGGADGYAWHTFTINAGGRSYLEYEAAGNGGQILIVVPEHELTVVLTGGNYNQGFIWSRWRDEIVGGMIIPSIVK